MRFQQQLRVYECFGRINQERVAAVWSWEPLDRERGRVNPTRTGECRRPHDRVIAASQKQQQSDRCRCYERP